jgi:hypothetical protein
MKMRFKNIVTEKGTYAAVKVSHTAAGNIIDTAKKLGIPNLLNPLDIHCTLLYSRKQVPLSGNIDVDYDALVSNFELFGDNKEILVIKLLSNDIKKRHKFLMDTYDATYDYDEYIPHITLSYNIDKFDISNIDIKAFNNSDFKFIYEYYEDLDLTKSF